MHKFLQLTSGTWHEHMGVCEMSQNKKCWSRRNFLKTAGAAGVGTLIAPIVHSADASMRSTREVADLKTIPKRPFGQTGVNVSILSLGGTIDISSNQLMLKQAIRWGVTYWDTAHSYRGGRSEKGVGKYLEKFPEDRNKIFLVTKSGAWTINGMTRHLNNSLERMNTDYIDLFFIHGMSNISEIDNETKRWAEKTKAEGKIRFFGFSTHSNMEECLMGAAKLGWIDGIMMEYNYRLMHTDRMRAAIDACTKAGIGLTAMKTQGAGAVKTNTETELKMAGLFLKKGFTDGQAKLKAVWQNPQIASICSRMSNLTLLMTNVAAALNKTKLSVKDIRLLKQYAAETASDYCASCSRICETALATPVPVANVMRYLMYSRSYGEHPQARADYIRLPAETRRRIAHIDYSAAEERCPQKMAIGKLMREASRELA
jgi:predicted aldo/keto reductase-like oxidoreductase